MARRAIRGTSARAWRCELRTLQQPHAKLALDGSPIDRQRHPSAYRELRTCPVEELLGDSQRSARWKQERFREGPRDSKGEKRGFRDAARDTLPGLDHVAHGEARERVVQPFWVALQRKC